MFGKVRLASGVHLVLGASRAALCDTNTGKVYSINEASLRVIHGQTEDDQFRNELLTMGLAAEGTADNDAPYLAGSSDIGLQFIWFEISADCNERCLHCYADSMPPSWRRRISVIPRLYDRDPEGSDASTRRRLAYREWQDLIKEGHDLGCLKCQFIGGEPFIYRGENGETVLDLARYARQVGYDFVEIFTNATLLTHEAVAIIKELGIHIATSLHSSRPEIHDGITRTRGSFRKTISALDMLKSEGVPTRVETTLMRPNEATAKETGLFIQEIGFQTSGPDVLRPVGRGTDWELMPSDEVAVRARFFLKPMFWADRAFFERSQTVNNCLAGKMAITDRGDVLPCCFSRDQLIGNVLETGSLETLVHDDRLQSIWRTTKDNVLVCRDCEYRYVCLDCRPLSESYADGHASFLEAPYPRCTYDPYSGRWGEGVWRVGGDGEPFYDTNWKPILQRSMPSEANEGGQ